MKTFEETLDLALEAFWAKVAELHPERETGDLDPVRAYDLENYARNALQDWLEANQPVFYVQRTMVQVVRITGTAEPAEAIVKAGEMGQHEWSDEALDTETDYMVLDKAGRAY